MVSKPIRITSLVLVGIGVILLALNIFVDSSLNVALPLVFLLLGGIFVIAVFPARSKWPWASVLFIPAALLIAFGVIFLLNVLTGDWSAWAYAWLLLVSGIGFGLVLACREQPWPPVWNLIGWGLALGGTTFFAVFGAIAGGVFIQVMAPILIILVGLSLYWLRIDRILPESARRRLNLTPPAKNAPPPAALVEPLSARELEVLQLVDQGLSNQEIALKLHVAQSTVKTHINNIYGKLGAQTRVQALNRARELGLLGS